MVGGCLYYQVGRAKGRELKEEQSVRFTFLSHSPSLPLLVIALTTGNHFRV